MQPTSPLRMTGETVLEQIAKKIKTLEAKKNRLLCEVAGVDQEIKLAWAIHGKLLNQNAPISCLPNEMLAMIFMACQQLWLQKSYSRSFEVVASHVSSHWRDVATGTPLLWSTIHVHVRRREYRAKNLERLSMYLARSDTCPLVITLKIHEEIFPFLDLLTPHVDRWSRLSVTTRRLDELNVHLYSLSPLILEHLSLCLEEKSHLPGAGAETMHDDFPKIFSGGAPCLGFVRVSGIAICCLRPPLTSVTTLHIDHATMDNLSHVRLQTMLRASPLLTNLSLFGVANEPTTISAPINTPNLRSLRVSGNSASVYRLLSTLWSPQLESLVLQAIDTFDWQFSIVFPVLHSLALNDCILLESEAKQFFRAFSALTHFQCGASDLNILRLLGLKNADLGLPSNDLPWPNLVTLSVKELAPPEVSPFCDMIANRKALGQPLTQLRLDRRTRTVLRHKGRLDGVRELVKVENWDHIDTWPVGLGYTDDGDFFWQNHWIFDICPL